MSAKWIIVLLSWFSPNVDVDRQEIPAGKTEAKCEAMMARVTKDWADADDGYGSAMNCQLNPEYKPKGKRK